MAPQVTPRWRRFARGERGSAAVESAVTAGVLFTVMIGLMKICLAVYTYHFISEAAREGTRYAIVRGSRCTPIPNSSFATACPASTTDIENYVKGLGYPGITPAAMTVTTTYANYPASATACFPSTNCNNPQNLATVQVQYAFPLSIPFMPNKTYTMTSTSALIISN